MSKSVCKKGGKMELKYKVLIAIVLTAIVMFPVSKTTHTSYPALFLASFFIETVVMVTVVVTKSR